MIPSLKSEFRKLLTARSTFGISIFFLVLLGVVSFYGQGYQAIPKDLNSLFFAGSLTAVANITSIAGALIALLLMAYEYRYNTISYTLTSSNSRSKVLASKILTVAGFVFVWAAIATALFLILLFAGVLAGGHSLPHQDINYLTFFAKSIFFCEAYAMAGLLIGTLVRSMPAAIVILLIVPNTLEQLIGAFLVKHPEKWLPFMSLSHVVDPAVIPSGEQATNLISPLRGAVTFLVYIVIGWAIGWYLFLRRDAN
ncbi:ABC transporter permease [Candidatus Saccharibacteria bacterium]|nr:ABC transporter permease [Candidatus Saccharibacteria bacterium]